jgi:hypothetical protein
MSAADRLVRLYPRAWRERYGDEFLAIVQSGPLNVQQIVDIVSGAIDAWLSADVQQATGPFRPASHGGRSMLKSLMCEQSKLRYTPRDSLIGASVMIGATLAFTLLGTAALSRGWPTVGEFLMQVAFFAALALSLPFWLTKGQPWKAQAAIVGASLSLLMAARYLAS